VLEDFPRAVLVELLQEVCLALRLADPTLAPGALHKLLAVLEGLPAMERFISGGRRSPGLLAGTP
jgi:hypothetical protein